MAARQVNIYGAALAFSGVSLKFMKIKPLYTCGLDIRSARKIASEFVNKK
jgi:hypothetical protein